MHSTFPEVIRQLSPSKTNCFNILHFKVVRNCLDKIFSSRFLLWILKFKLSMLWSRKQVSPLKKSVQKDRLLNYAFHHPSLAIRKLSYQTRTWQLPLYVNTRLYKQPQWLLYRFCNCMYSFPGSAAVLEA